MQFDLELRSLLEEYRKEYNELGGNGPMDGKVDSDLSDDSKPLGNGKTRSFMQNGRPLRRRY